MKKWIVICLVTLIFVLQTRLWGNKDGIRDVLHLRQSIELQSQEIDRLRLRNQQLDAEVRALKNFPEALEERARAELGMIKETETFCLILER